MTAVAGKVRAALLATHPRHRWRVAFEVRLPTPESQGPRRVVDVVALGRRYPEVHGFEVKVSRADLQSELAQPDKAEAARRFVNFWWLVAGDPAVIDGITVPDWWGILVVKDGRLVLVRAAPALHNGAKWSGNIPGRFVLAFLDALEARSEEPEEEELNLP